MNTLPNETIAQILSHLNNVELSLFLSARDKSGHTCTINDIGLYSAKCGNVEILKYAVSYGYTPTLALSAIASEKGHYDYVKYLQYKLYPINNITTVYAVKGKCKEILELLGVNTSGPLFYEEVFCTGDCEFVNYVLDKYGCDVQIESTKCAYMDILQLLLNRNIITESFLQSWPDYQDIVKAKQLDTLVGMFGRRCSYAVTQIKAILRFSIATCDLVWIKSVLDNDILFPVETMTYKEKIMCFCNVNDIIMFDTTNQIIPILQWLIYTVRISDSNLTWSKPYDFDTFMWLTNKGINVGAHAIRYTICRCIEKNDLEGIKYFKENNKTQMIKYAMETALTSGNIDLVIWILENGYVFRSQRLLINYACKANIETLQYIYSRYSYVFGKYDQDIMLTAIQNGDIDIVKFLYGHGCPKSSICIDVHGSRHRNYSLNHIAKHDDVQMLHELRTLGFRYSGPFITRYRDLFAAKCYIYTTEDESYDTSGMYDILKHIHSYNNKCSNLFLTCESMYQHIDIVYGKHNNVYAPELFSETYIPVISELNNYVCNHTYCKDMCGSVRCLYKGMLEIREYDKKKLFA